MSKHPDEDKIRLIHALATRLPWIVVIVVLITAIITILEVIFHKI